MWSLFPALTCVVFHLKLCGCLGFIVTDWKSHLCLHSGSHPTTESALVSLGSAGSTFTLHPALSSLFQADTDNTNPFLR